MNINCGVSFQVTMKVIFTINYGMGLQVAIKRNKKG